MNKITYIKASQNYVKSFCSTVGTVARERKYLASTTGFPEESAREFVKNITNNNFAQYYAVTDEEVIGWCDIIPKSYEGFRHVGVLGIGVLSQYRHKGIGRKLFELTVKHAKEKNNIEKIEMEVFKSNKTAVNFYLKQGFMIEGERIRSRKLDGEYDNLIIMGKEI